VIFDFGTVCGNEEYDALPLPDFRLMRSAIPICKFVRCDQEKLKLDLRDPNRIKIGKYTCFQPFRTLKHDEAIRLDLTGAEDEEILSQDFENMISIEKEKTKTGQGVPNIEQETTKIEPETVQNPPRVMTCLGGSSTAGGGGIAVRDQYPSRLNNSDVGALHVRNQAHGMTNSIYASLMFDSLVPPHTSKRLHP